MPRCDATVRFPRRCREKVNKFFTRPERSTRAVSGERAPGALGFLIVSIRSRRISPRSASFLKKRMHSGPTPGTVQTVRTRNAAGLRGTKQDGRLFLDPGHACLVVPLDRRASSATLRAAFSVKVKFCIGRKSRAAGGTIRTSACGIIAFARNPTRRPCRPGNRRDDKSDESDHSHARPPDRGLQQGRTCSRDEMLTPRPPHRLGRARPLPPPWLGPGILPVRDADRPGRTTGEFRGVTVALTAAARSARGNAARGSSSDLRGPRRVKLQDVIARATVRHRGWPQPR